MASENNETFNIEPRTAGKHFSRKSRKMKKIPAVVYGPKVQNQNVVVDELFIEKHRSQKFESSIFKTASSASQLGNLNVMLKKIDYHPVSGRPVHVDFYALDMSEKIKVKVPIAYQGEPVGCKEEGGVRQIILHEVELECAPADIPKEVVVDISHVQLNSSVHVSEFAIPDSVKLITSGDRTAMTVALPKEEKAAEPAVAVAAEGEAAAADPKAAAEKK